jgi:hypothetical protein
MFVWINFGISRKVFPWPHITRALVMSFIEG